MITKEKKQEIIARLTDHLKDTSGLYLINYVGMTVEDAINMRRAFKEKGVAYMVAKNTLIRRALDEVGGFDVPPEKLTGMTGLAFGFSDPVEPSKILKDFIEKNEKPELKAAVIEGQFYEGSRLDEITKLPSREDMIAGIIGSLNAPVSGIVSAIEDPAKGIVGALGNVTRDLASLIEEVAKKQNAA